MPCSQCVKRAGSDVLGQILCMRQSLLATRFDHIGILLILHPNWSHLTSQTCSAHYGYVVSQGMSKQKSRPLQINFSICGFLVKTTISGKPMSNYGSLTLNHLRSSEHVSWFRWTTLVNGATRSMIEVWPYIRMTYHQSKTCSIYTTLQGMLKLLQQDRSRDCKLQ